MYLTLTPRGAEGWAGVGGEGGDGGNAPRHFGERFDFGGTRGGSARAPARAAYLQTPRVINAKTCARARARSTAPSSSCHIDHIT